MTPVGLMIGVLNKWLRESVEPAVDCADVILLVLQQNGYSVVCATCGKHWTEYCACDRSQASASVNASPSDSSSGTSAQEFR